MALNFYPHTATFNIPGQRVQVDYDWVEQPSTEIEVVCNMQPTTSAVKQGEDGQTSEIKFNCFIRRDTWDERIENASSVLFKGEEWAVLNVRQKQKFGHRVNIGVITT